MRKYSVLALLFIILILAVIGLITLGDNNSVEPEIIQGVVKESEPIVESNQFLREQNETDNKLSSEKEPALDCHTQYQKHPNWQEISDIYESFYLSIGEMMGEHHYQQMPLDAVKSYADAGDANAMFHYGSELIWKGGFGIYFNELNRAETLTPEERKERIDNHQLNLPMLEQGAGYLVDSAIQGKLGGLIELQLLSHHILKRQVSREANLENTRQALMLSMAYEALLKQVFIHDAEMMQDFTFADDRAELVQQFLKNHPQLELEPIEQEANKIRERLFGYWQDKRESLGLPNYPDKFPPHLEQHVKDKRRLCDG